MVEDRGVRAQENMVCKWGMGGRREKRQEVGVLKGYETGEIGENYTTMFCILQSKKGGGKRRKLRKKRGREQRM